MACYAVATATASVELQEWERIKSLLPGETLKKVIGLYLKETYKTEPYFYSESVLAGGFEFYLGRKLVVSGEGLSQADVEKASAGLVSYLAKAAGMVLQNKVKETAKRLGRIEGTQKAANGALVISLDI